MRKSWLECVYKKVSVSYRAEPTNIMPFLATEHIEIPNKDLLSWMFDDQKYDQDKPVSG